MLHNGLRLDLYSAGQEESSNGLRLDLHNASKKKQVRSQHRRCTAATMHIVSDSSSSAAWPQTQPASNISQEY
jgi:hypothetical protein